MIFEKQHGSGTVKNPPAVGVRLAPGASVINFVIITVSLTISVQLHDLNYVQIFVKSC